MDKFIKFLIIIAAGCLLLAACGGEVSAITPGEKTNPAGPTLESTQENAPSVTPNVNAKPVTSTVESTQGKEMIITQDMNGKTVSLQVGDIFEVHIPTIPTSGYDWKSKDLDTKILSQVGDSIYTADTSPNAAGGIVSLKFKAVGAGKTTLTLLYIRSAENGVPSLYSKSFGVNIVVK